MAYSEAYNTTIFEEYNMETTEDYNATNFTDYSDYNYTYITHYDNMWINSTTRFFKTTGIVLGSLFALILYKNLAEKRRNEIYDTLNMMHVMFGILHAILINLPVKKMDCSSESSELICILELGIPMWTVCISLKMFTDLYLFQNRSDVYSAKDLTIFGFSSIATVHVYELLFIMLGELLVIGVNYASAVRLVCVLLTMSLPMAIACVMIKSLLSKSCYFVKPLGLFLLFHLSVFVLCDMCVAFYIIAMTTRQNSWVVDLFTVLLYYRLVLEVAWFVGSHYLGKALRIYKD